MINNGEKVYIVSVNDIQYIGRLSYKGIQAYLKLQGFQGTPGASIVWKGTWSSGSSYSVLDAVTYNGQIYISKLASTNKVPTNTTYWDLACEKGSDGEIGLNWLGAWNSGTTYEIGDGVSNDGSSYICNTNNTNQEPPNASYWDVLALAGSSSFDIHGLTEKTSFADNDEFPFADSAASYNNKKGLWSTIKSQLKTYFDTLFVPLTRTVNSKALSGNITLTQDDVGDGSTYKQYSSTEKSKLSGIASGAEVNAASNLGTGEGVYSSKAGASLQLKSIKAGTNITLSSDANEVTINASGGSGDITKDELAAGTTVTDITTGAYVAITRPGSPNTIEKITKASLTTLFATDVGAAIDGAGELTTLASDDKIAVWDESASALKYITQANHETQRWLADNPIGTVRMFDNSTSDPNSKGGTWSRIDGPAFPGMYKSGDTNMGTPMGTFGSNTKNLRHSHAISQAMVNVAVGTPRSININANTDNALSTTQDVLNAGITLCFWRRTA